MSSFTEDDLLCPQCSEIYCYPVLLKCGHNVCKVCLHNYWAWKESRVCPVCCAASVFEKLQINHALKRAVDSYQEQRTYRNQDFCFYHNEKLDIFCQKDEKPICLVCQRSKQHSLHECCTVKEAAPQKKEEVSSMLVSLRTKLKTLNKTKEQWEETRSFLQTQTNETENLIKEEFRKLHVFLQEEEMSRVMALKQEQDIKTQVMSEKLETIEDQIEALASTISDVEKCLRLNNVLFLQCYKETKKRVKLNIPEPECVRDILINAAKHLASLKFEAWRKMADIVQYVPVTMDPNTAQPNLKFSEEFSCVQYSTKLLLPDNPERCSSRMCVLGATGFMSGKHSWTVDVGQGKDWYIGVAQESVKRKQTVFLKPAEGFWTIGLCNGDTFWAQTSLRTKLVLKQKPERIRVELDCDKGKVAFINTDDQTTIHTFKDRFTEKVFPYFSPGLCEQMQMSSPLKVCPLTIKVDLE